MKPLIKKSLGVFYLTSCKGCLSTLLDNLEKLAQINNFYEFKVNPEIAKANTLDVALVEGRISDEKQKELLKSIRKAAKTVIALGNCANHGGVLSPKLSLVGGHIKPISKVIKVDYSMPGCPINPGELYQCLLDIYWGKHFNEKALPVCFECHKNGLDCILKERIACLGPITRSGCDAVCLQNNKSCDGCRGTVEDPNIEKMRESLNLILSEKETDQIINLMING